MNKNKKTGLIGIIITIIILCVLVFLTNVNISNYSYAESVLGKIVMPVQNGLTYLKNKMAGNSTFFQDMNSLKSENAQLKDDNTKLQQSLSELEMIKAENSTLKEYAGLINEYPDYTAVPAYIINKNVSNLSDTFIINAGTDNGVYANMPVISGEGLVGFVISSAKKTAAVQPIIDPTSNVSCNIGTGTETMIAKGNLGDNSHLKLTLIPTDCDLMIGGTLQTSGIGGIYPKGILIGTIKDITNTKNVTDRYATVETAVNFAKLDTVLVITNQ